MNGISRSKIITKKVSVMRCIHMSWNWYRWLQLVIFVPFAKRKCTLPSYFIVNTSSVRTVSLSGKFSLSCACMGRSFHKLLIKYSDVALFQVWERKDVSSVQGTGQTCRSPVIWWWFHELVLSDVLVQVISYIYWAWDTALWPGISKQASYHIVVYMLRCSDSSWSFL